MFPIIFELRSFTHLGWAQLAARNGGQGKPEMRVPAILVGSLIIPIGLLYVPIFSRVEFGPMLTFHAIPWALP